MIGVLFGAASSLILSCDIFLLEAAFDSGSSSFLGLASSLILACVNLLFRDVDRCLPSPPEVPDKADVLVCAKISFFYTDDSVWVYAKAFSVGATFDVDLAVLAAPPPPPRVPVLRADVRLLKSALRDLERDCCPRPLAVFPFCI